SSAAGSAGQRASVAVISHGCDEEKEKGFLTAYRESLLWRAEEMVPGDAAELLLRELTKEMGPGTEIGWRRAIRSPSPANSGPRGEWAGAWGGGADGVDPAEAARVCNAAARLLTQALENENLIRQDVAGGLEAVADRLEPAEAARVCGAVTRLLTPPEWMKYYPTNRRDLVRILAAVVGRL